MRWSRQLKACGAKRVLDLGCSTGNLLKRLLDEPQFTEIVGVDVSHRRWKSPPGGCRLERLPPAKAQRIKLLHGSLTYRDRRLAGYDAAAIVEVIEHLDPPRLAALERAVFEFARPKTVVVTTPNREYNVLFPGMQPGKLRHSDHRFEWTRERVSRLGRRRWRERFGYQLRLVADRPGGSHARLADADGGVSAVDPRAMQSMQLHSETLVLPPYTIPMQITSPTCASSS